MNRILVISNRLPVSISKIKNSLQFKPSTGGLATGMSALQERYEMRWIGWPGTTEPTEKDKKVIQERLEESNMEPIFLTKHQVENYYYNFSNRTIWPLFHYFTQHTVYDTKAWNAYKQVNNVFMQRVLKNYHKGDIIWVHDYQLMLLPEMIRKELPDAMIAYFLHIPFPSFEIFRYLPWRNEILDGLLGADLVGFHTFDYARHFYSSIMRLRGLEHHLGEVRKEDRVIRVDSFPMGINYKKYAEAIQDEQVKKEVRKYQQICKEGKTILSIDRLDYSKGILQRLYAFHQILHDDPSLLGKVTLILLVVPSRMQVESYKQLKHEIDEFVGRINGDHGTFDWTPIKYFYRALPFPKIAALYNISDICLVTPFRDGMNLVAKEFVASKEGKEGVLILSEMTGAVNELSEALIINPNDIQSIVDAFLYAINEMPINEQISRLESMQMRLKRYDIYRWSDDFMERLEHIKNLQQAAKVKLLSTQRREELIQNFSHSKQRLVLLDYDGTLIPFTAKPDEAKPDKELLQMLRKINSFENTNLVIISGRDKETLDNWLGDLGLNMVAEHGAWIKEQGTQWDTLEPHTQEWKKEIRQILEFYVDRTPGAFIEEKTFSLVWHYRRANIGLGEVRARELADNLSQFTLNMNLQVLEGNKVIEIKNAGINKGRATLSFLKQKDWDFIIAIGDDETDEDTFNALPEFAYSIKVGTSSSVARHNLQSHKEVRTLLKTLTERSFDEKNS